MDCLTSLYPLVREVLREAIPSDWPELEDVLAHLREEQLPTEAII